MEFLFLALIALGVPFVLPIVSWVSARRTRARLETVEKLLTDQAAAIRRLEGLVGSSRGPAGAEVPASSVERPPAVSSPAAPAGTAAPPVAPPPASPPARPSPLATPPLVSRAPVPPPAPRPAVPPAQVPVVDDARRPAAERPPTVVTPPAAATATPKPPFTPPRPPVTPIIRPPAPPFDWENLVGVKLFSAIAGIALVLAAVFFLRYSIEHGWLQPPIRVAIGIAVAIALLAACELKAARRYPATANALDAAAIAILFATFFAAHALWNLIPSLVAFVLLAVVTALAVLLSIRRGSLFIAVLGLLGGFATPALLSSGANQPIPLFAYLVLLNVGLAWVAYRQRWPVLSVLTLVLTTVYQWGWVFRFLDASQMPLAMGIFAVFPAIAMAALVLARPRAGTGGDGAFAPTALAAAMMPLLFAAYLSAIPAYGAHPALLFGFLFFVDAGLLAISVVRRDGSLHAAGAVSTVVVMAVWLAASYVHRGAVVALGASVVLAGLYSLGGAIARRVGRPFEGAADSAGYAAPLLLVVPMVIPQIDPATANPWPLVFAALPILLLSAWRAVVEGRGGLYFTAAFLAVGVQASWSAVHLDIDRLGTAVRLYALFGVVSLAVPVIARRVRRPLEPRSGAGVVLIASLGLLLFLSSGPIAPAALWALALLLAILNAGLFVEAAAGELPMLSIVGSAVSWVILAGWWTRAAGAVGILPSLAVLGSLSLVTLAGHTWEFAQVRAARVAAVGTGFTRGLFLALGGHLFLLFLVTNPAWSLPPWPWMATLGLLTLAMSCAALFTGVAALHAAGAIAAASVVVFWTPSASEPWLSTGILASIVVSLYAAAWMVVDARVGSARRTAGVVDDTVPVAAGAALVAGEVTAVLAVATGDVVFPLVIGAHLFNLSALLGLAWRWRWRHVAPFAVLLAAAALVVQAGHPGELAIRWPQLLALAGAILFVFVAYPLGVARGARGARDPYVAAVLASAVCFLAGKAALEAGGYGWMVGALPVFQGAVMTLLLRQLLAAEPPGARDLGRLALVAGTALAFVTVAIPLQLRHQWITIGWALEAAALVWLHGRIRHRGLIGTAAALFGTVFVRLALNPGVLLYEPRGPMRIVNWYLYAYVICAVAFLVAAWWLARRGDSGDALATTLARWLPAGAVILLFLLLNIEIADYYATGAAIVFRFGVTVSQDLTYTIGWLIFGMALLGVCIYIRSHPGRIAALALIAVTTFKCFLYDLGSLVGLYRVASFVGLATALALVSLALQKYVLAKPEAER